MVGTSYQSVPEMAIDSILTPGCMTSPELGLPDAPLAICARG
jgi:hypothetical protein